MVGSAVGLQCEDEGLVVREDLEVASLDVRHESAHGKVHGQEFTSECAVAALGRRELA